MGSNGVMRCQGHCGPILKSGCQTFFFGHSDGGVNEDTSTAGTYVLNWRSCGSKCESYCNNPTSNGCFTTAASPNASTYDKCPSSGSSVSASILIIVAAIMLAVIM